MSRYRLDVAWNSIIQHRVLECFVISHSSVLFCVSDGVFSSTTFASSLRSPSRWINGNIYWVSSHFNLTFDSLFCLFFIKNLPVWGNTTNKSFPQDLLDVKNKWELLGNSVSKRITSKMCLDIFYIKLMFLSSRETGRIIWNCYEATWLQGFDCCLCAVKRHWH